MIEKMKISSFFVIPSLLVILMVIGSLEKEQTHAQEIIDATDFGVIAGTDESQTQALHAAMRYFFDNGQEGTVYLPAGTYAVDEALRFHEGVNLVGDGVGQTVIQKIGSQNNYVVGNPIFHGNSYDLNVTVSGITFDADRTNRASQGLGQVGGMNIDALVSNLTLENIEVRDATIGLLVRRLRDSIITESYFDNTSGHAIGTGSESHPVGDFTDVVISNNLITNSIGGSGINLSRAANTTVSNNEIINSQQQSDSYGGIRIPNGGENNTVSNNVIENYPRGIFVTTGANNNHIFDNTVIDSRIHGVLLESDDNVFSGNVFIQNDTSLNPESVIRLAGANGNQILENEMETHSGFSNIGIRLTDSSNNEIRDNITDTSGVPVSIEGGTGNIDEGNINP